MKSTKILISAHLKELGRSLDLCSANYMNHILLGDLDFNTEPNEQNMNDFCQAYGYQIYTVRQHLF